MMLPSDAMTFENGVLGVNSGCQGAVKKILVYIIRGRGGQDIGHAP